MSHAASWEEIEEIEEVVIQQNIQMTPVTRAQQSWSSTSSHDATSGKNLTLEEWGSNVISFGRKAQGEVLRSSHAPGPRVLPLEPSSVLEPDAGAARLRSVWTALDDEEAIYDFIT